MGAMTAPDRHAVADSAPAVLRLDPRSPLLWRDPTTLQIGIDPVLAVLDDVEHAHLRLVDALVVGVSRAGLEHLAGHLAVPLGQLHALLDRLGSALKASAVDPAPAEPLAVVGTGIGAERVAAVLAEAGHPVTLMAPGTALDDHTRWAAALLVSAHVADPLEHPRWLRRDIAHLPIVFGEVAVTVGPLVVPGLSPCLTCVERQRARHDPARSALATQLWGRTAAAETPSIALEAAVTALWMLRSRDAGTSVRIDPSRGTRTRVPWSLADDCRCADLSPCEVPAARRGTGSEPARRGSSRAARPTIAPAHAARG